MWRLKNIEKLRLKLLREYPTAIKLNKKHYTSNITKKNINKVKYSILKSLNGKSKDLNGYTQKIYIVIVKKLKE